MHSSSVSWELSYGYDENSTESRIKIMKYARLLVLSMVPYISSSAVSIVYNFRIAQITKQPIVESVYDHNYTLVALFFDQFQKKYSDVRQNFLGGLASFIYDFEPYYFRTDFSSAHIKEVIDHATTYSGIKTDDILFTLGRNFKLNNKAVMTLSGLFGIPTHEIFTLQHIDFGYGQVGLGVQLDGSYILCDTHTLLYGIRYLYFVPRKAVDEAGDTYTFTIGNIVDVLFAYKYNWLSHGLECGYTFRSDFGAHISPNLDDTVKKTDYIRSNFYFVYKYKFMIDEIANRLLFNISYGFDHRPKVYGNQYIVTLWASWNIHF